MASNRAVGRSSKSPGSGRRKASVLIGIFLLFIAIAAIVIGRDGENKQKLEALADSVKPAGEPVEVSLLVGSEKRDFLGDARVVEAFRDAGFAITVHTMGSLEMAERVRDGSLPLHDFYFPASSGNEELIGFVGGSVSQQAYLQSNIAIVARRDVAEDLAAQGYVERAEQNFQAEPATLLQLFTSGQRWREVTQSYQSPLAVGVQTSDPTRSFSSSQFAYLMAHALSDGNLDTPAAIAEAAGQVKPIFQSQGLTEGSSGDSFNQFIASNGQGIPMTVAYDSQYFAFVIRQPERAQEFALINLVPTVNIEHELIARENAPQAEEFFEVLKGNRQVQQTLAEYGFAAPPLQSIVPAPPLEKTTALAEELERLM